MSISSEIETTYKKVWKFTKYLSKKILKMWLKNIQNDSTAKSGGNIGWKKEQDLPELFNDQIAKINVGEITKPFKSPNGFHILKINEKKGS